MPRNSPECFLILILMFSWVLGSAPSGVYSETLQEEPLEIHVFYVPCELCVSPTMSEIMNETVYPFYEQYRTNAMWNFYKLEDTESFEVLTSLVGEDQLYDKDPPYVVFASFLRNSSYHITTTNG